MVFAPLLDLPPIPHDQAQDLRHFHPPPGPEPSSPKDHYHDAMNRCTAPGLRYVRKDNPREMLIYIAGSCSHHSDSNNEGTPRAGYGVKWSARDSLSSRLEGSGPETCHRAELRAAIVALGLRVWNGEGFDGVVLACDSEYVVAGISSRVRDWMMVKSNGTKMPDDDDDENQDLWEVLLAALREQDDRGVLVRFWLIASEENEAGGYAKAGTLEEDRREHMGEVFAF